MNWKKEIKKLCWDFVLSTDTTEKIIQSTEDRYKEKSIKNKDSFMYNQAQRLVVHELCLAYGME